MLGLKLMRLINEMTPEEVGKIVNITRPMISAWENGSRKIPEKRLYQLAEVFNVDPSFLLQEVKVPDVEKALKIKELSGDCYYSILRKEYPKADALYEDTIIKAVGAQGLQKLREERLIESCAVLEGRKLYAL